MASGFPFPTLQSPTNPKVERGRQLSLHAPFLDQKCFVTRLARAREPLASRVVLLSWAG